MSIYTLDELELKSPEDLGLILIEKIKNKETMDLALMELLIEIGANVNMKEYYTGKTALHYAADMGHLEIVTLLLEHDADINVKNNRGTNALHFAVEKGHLEVVQLLLDNGVDIHSRAR